MRERESRANPRDRESSRRNVANRTISRGIRLFAYTRFGEKYSKMRKILRGKALLAPAAFLPKVQIDFAMPALEARLQFSPFFACKLTQFCAISRERTQKSSCYFASLRATCMRSHEIH